MALKIQALGEVLWDCLPTGRKLGGAPANFAYHCRSLGADVDLVTRVGDDDLGRETLDRLQAMGLPTAGVQVDRHRPTGTVAVELSENGQARYTFPPDVAWDAIEADERALSQASQADAVYFGTLAQRTETSRRSIRRLVDATRPDALRMFDINLRQQFYDREATVASLELASALKLNEEELPVLTRMLGLPDGVRAAIEALAARFGLSLVALTRGPGGSLLLAEDAWCETPGYATQVIDTIGAGDAFTAAVVLGRLTKRPLDEIGRQANAVAAYVCAQPGGAPELPPHLREALADRRSD